ncbi:MAG: DUF1559 domain-containing protein [Acidobacteriales bacterium]|nr:DUF1559 domain-containing protein [Terriglobales bacterium]
MNNLKQIGLAFHSHHDVFKHLPTGGRNTPPDPPNTAATVKADFSWCYQILPFIEQDNLFKQTSNSVLDTRPVPIYYCPSRRGIQLYHGDAICDYGGNVGTDQSNGLNGVLVRTSQPKLHLLGILDGTSNTLLVGERRVNVALISGTTDTQDNEPCFRYGWDGDGLRSGRNSPPQPDLANSALAPATPHWQFGSSHTGGMNGLLADGSVRIIRYGINLTTFQRLCVRNDGRTFNQDEL